MLCLRAAVLAGCGTPALAGCSKQQVWLLVPGGWLGELRR